MWQSSWAGVSSLVLGIFALTNIAGYTRGPWWLYLTIGLFFVLVGLVNLRSAFKLYRNRRRPVGSSRLNPDAVVVSFRHRAGPRRGWRPGPPAVPAEAVYRSRCRRRSGQQLLRCDTADLLEAMIPCVVLYLALQRYYVQGLMSGAVKG